MTSQARGPREPPLLMLLEHAAAAADAHVGARCTTGDWYRAAIARLKRESLTSPEVCARINGALMPIPDEVPDAD